MSDFIREVDEGVRQDRARRFLQRYWVLLAAAAVLVLAGVGAWRALDTYRTGKAQAAGGRYLDALDLARDGKDAEAATVLQGVAADGTPGYRLLARFRVAAETGKTDQPAGARLFDAIGADPDVDGDLRGLARLRAAALLVDTVPYPEIRKRLEPLADANSGLRNSARELLAAAALKAGADEDAGRALDAIETDPTATPGLRQRAEAMLGLVRAGKADVLAEPAASAATVAAPPSAPVAPAFTLPGAPPLVADQPAPAEPAPETPPAAAPTGDAIVSLPVPAPETPAAVAAPDQPPTAAPAPAVPPAAALPGDAVVPFPASPDAAGSPPANPP